jgi:hypothetical protein
VGGKVVDDLDRNQVSALLKVGRRGKTYNFKKIAFRIRRRMRAGMGEHAKACHLLVFEDKKHDLHLDMPLQLKVPSLTIHLTALAAHPSLTPHYSAS